MCNFVFSYTKKTYKIIIINNKHFTITGSDSFGSTLDRLVGTLHIITQQHCKYVPL